MALGTILPVATIAIPADPPIYKLPVLIPTPPVTLSAPVVVDIACVLLVEVKALAVIESPTTDNLFHTALVLL